MCFIAAQLTPNDRKKSQVTGKNMVILFQDLGYLKFVDSKAPPLSYFWFICSLRS